MLFVNLNVFSSRGNSSVVEHDHSIYWDNLFLAELTSAMC